MQGMVTDQRETTHPIAAPTESVTDTEIAERNFDGNTRLTHLLTPHARIHMHTHSHTLTHTYLWVKHTHTLTYTHSHTLTHIPHTLTRAGISYGKGGSWLKQLHKFVTPAVFKVDARTRAHTYKHTHTHTYTLTCTHTYTYTHSLTGRHLTLLQDHTTHQQVHSQEGITALTTHKRTEFTHSKATHNHTHTQTNPHKFNHRKASKTNTTTQTRKQIHTKSAHRKGSNATSRSTAVATPSSRTSWPP